MYYINKIKATAKSHTYHMLSFEDRPPPYFLDQILADPVLNIPECSKLVLKYLGQTRDKEIPKK